MKLVWHFDGEEIPFDVKVVDNGHLHFHAHSSRLGGCGISLFTCPVMGQTVWGNILLEGKTEQKEFKGDGFDCVQQAADWINAETARLSQAVPA